MPSMTDPMNALNQFQKAFEVGLIPVQAGRLDQTVLFAPDHANGRARFNYMRTQGETLIALVMFVQTGLEDGNPVFSIGYAVADDYRGRGLAKSTLLAALTELSAGLASANIPAIQVEAVISLDNLASQAVATAVFDDTPRSITDSVSGEPALLYSRRVTCWLS